MREAPVAQVQSATTHLLTALFEGLLADLADTDAFTEEGSPSIFLVYAHESGCGTADSAKAQKLIRWLSYLRSKILSDRTSALRLWSTREDGNAPTHDILSNQFCLLPQRARASMVHKKPRLDKIGAVDKVVLCCSEVLQSYNGDTRMRSYIDSIKEFYFRSLQESHSMEEIKEGIKAILKKHRYNREYFHHILTEMTFLEIRSIQEKEPEKIIPIVLNGDNIEYLPYFQNAAPLWLKAQGSDKTLDECQALHKLFFNLLRLLYEHQHTIIDEFEQCYTTCFEKISTDAKLPSSEEFRRFVANEVVKTLDRLKRHGLAIVRFEPKATDFLNENELQEYYQVPPRHVAKFIGRNEIMKTLEATLNEPSIEAPQVVILHGMGGQGKTQIALKYCIQARAARKYFGTFWVEASSEKAIAEEIKSPGRLFQDEASMLAFVNVNFESWSRPWLVVLDNWDDVSAFSNLRDYIPKNRSCSAIITTRHIDSCRLGIQVEVPRMTESEAIDLLFHQADIVKAEENEGSGRIIAERLGYLPLALDQAGAYIRRRKGSISIDGFLEHYERRKKFVLNATPEVWEYRKKLNPAEMETSLSVATTWEMSVHQICTDDEVGHRKSDFLNLFAFFNHRKISENLFASYYSSNRLLSQRSWFRNFAGSSGDWSSDAFEEVLVSFHDLSLIETFWRESDQSLHFSLHPLVKDWIQIRQKKGECQQSCFVAAQVLSSFLQNVYENQEFRLPFSAKQDVFMHVKAWDEGYKAFIEPVQRLERNIWDALANSELCFADYSKQCGRLDEAKDLYARVLEYRKLTSDSQQVILSVATKLGWIYEMQGNFLEAESSLRSACELGKTALGPTNPETLLSLNLLGLVLTDEGKYEEAAKLHSWILKVRESVLGTDHLDTLHSRHNMANNLIYLGLYKQGEEYYRQIFTARERVLGKDHFDTLNSLCCLASTLHHQGFLKKAEELYREAYDRSEAALGEEHLDTLDSLYKLAGTLLRRGKAVEAEEMCKKMVGIGGRTLGPDHPLVLLCLNEMARTLVEQGKNQEAKGVYLRVIKAREHRLPKSHPATMVSINELSRCLYRYGEIEEASKVFQKVVASDELKWGKPHPPELLRLFGLASSVLSRQRYEQLLGNQKPKVENSDLTSVSEEVSEQNRALDSIHRLANLFCDQGRYMEAEKAYRQELETCQKIWGESHERALLCLFNLARVYFHQGRYTEALGIRAQEQALNHELKLTENPDEKATSTSS